MDQIVEYVKANLTWVVPLIAAAVGLAAAIFRWLGSRAKVSSQIQKVEGGSVGIQAGRDIRPEKSKEK